jgi:5-methylcytosine-specific restriction endonuclease McrA
MNKCDNCGAEVVKPQQHTKGVTPPANEGHADHFTARAKGGSGTPDNGQLLCRDCNLEKGAQ